MRTTIMMTMAWIALSTAFALPHTALIRPHLTVKFCRDGDVQESEFLKLDYQGMQCQSALVGSQQMNALIPIDGPFRPEIQQFTSLLLDLAIATQIDEITRLAIAESLNIEMLYVVDSSNQKKHFKILISPNESHLKRADGTLVSFTLQLQAIYGADLFEDLQLYQIEPIKEGLTKLQEQLDRIALEDPRHQYQQMRRERMRQVLDQEMERMRRYRRLFTRD